MNKVIFQIMLVLTGIEYIGAGFLMATNHIIMGVVAVSAAILFHWYSIHMVERSIK